MKITKEQREGITKTLDTLATTSLVGAVVGVTGHAQISSLEIGLLFGIAVDFFMLTFFLRG